MNMSYRRAWLLIDELNSLFKSPLVATRAGGDGGGGAELTPFGKSMVRYYRDMEIEAQAAAALHFRAFQVSGGRRPDAPAGTEERRRSG
jgi:molybdate transport system regulatory protein